VIERLNRNAGRLLFGLLVTGAGLLLTLDNLDVLEAEPLLRWLPVLVIAAGVVKLVGLGPFGRNVGFGLLLLVVGTWLTVNTFELVENPVDLWPLLLIVGGGYLAYTAFRSPRPLPTDVDSEISALAVLSGVERKNSSQHFSGGQATAFMGGVEIDLASARTDAGPAVIEVFAMWGGIEVKVPTDWRVTSEVLALMGSFEDKTTPPAGEAGGHLVVRGLAIMGGVEVKN